MFTCFVTAQEIDACQAGVLKQYEQETVENGAAKEDAEEPRERESGTSKGW